ncbi:MAG: DoxX family protein [Candidatus Sulfotelmatobacter sp.]
MAVLVVLLVSWVVFRGIGLLGVSALASWQASARYALAVMFAMTGSAHFTRMKHDLALMVPRAFPRPMWIVYVTGVLEFLGAVGLLVPKMRTVAGICLIVLLLAMFPANVRAARERLPLRGKPATALWLRLPMQIFFIGLIWWASR